MLIMQFLVSIVIALAFSIGIYFLTKARVGCAQYNITIMNFHTTLMDASRMIITLQNGAERTVEINKSWAFEELAKICRHAKPTKELCDNHRTQLQFTLWTDLQMSKFECCVSQMRTDDLIITIPDLGNLGTNVRVLLPGLNRWLIENIEGYNRLLE
jgi:hypothetical protein